MSCEEKAKQIAKEESLEYAGELESPLGLDVVVRSSDGLVCYCGQYYKDEEDGSTIWDSVGFWKFPE